MNSVHTFEEIQGGAIADAEKVSCSRSTYHRGLAAMFHTLKEHLESEGVDPLDPEFLDDDDTDEHERPMFGDDD
jgi:hypothetical protein